MSPNTYPVLIQVGAQHLSRTRHDRATRWSLFRTGTQGIAATFVDAWNDWPVGNGRGTVGRHRRRRSGSWTVGQPSLASSGLQPNTATQPPSTSGALQGSCPGVRRDTSAPQPARIAAWISSVENTGSAHRSRPSVRGYSGPFGRRERRVPSGPAGQPARDRLDGGWS